MNRYLNLLLVSVFLSSSNIAIAQDVHVPGNFCSKWHIFWMLMSFGLLNAVSKGLDWLASVIPGELDNKIFAKIKAVLGFFQKIIDFFIANSKR